MSTSDLTSENNTVIGALAAQRVVPGHLNMVYLESPKGHQSPHYVVGNHNVPGPILGCSDNVVVMQPSAGHTSESKESKET